ncbi:type II/IV secretion system ATPase subunit [Candidatus Pacearchaeota archaeon]|nr:type II/IV secretion system ATPase subunit [Candidatus Pacearchaeota archaeon]
MIFRPETALYDFEIIREAGEDVMYINYLGATTVPSISGSAVCMARTIDSLVENPKVSRIVFVQQRNYSYDFPQVSLLVEIAQLYTHLLKQERVISVERLAPFACKKCLPQRYNSMNYLILTLLKQDPIGCYVEARRLLREERINAEKLPESCKKCEDNYLALLEKILGLMENTQLVKQARPHIEAYHIGNREVYTKLFNADIIPNFTFTRLSASFPEESEIVAQYDVLSGYDRSNVTILKLPSQPKFLYHITPPEFQLREDYYMLLNLARNVLIEHRPKAEEFTDPERTRQVFFSIARDLLQELADNKKIKLAYRQLNKLAAILVRHTIGFGLIEVLLQDEKLQDISINSPIGQTAIFVRHAEFDECYTNIMPSVEDANSWAAKFRMLSGRPLDEANPILDTDLVLGNVRARVAVIQQPLSPYGLAYAFRRHRESPWTLPLFIKNRMLNPLAAGLLSFMIDGARTMLVAGTRSAGKTSLLGSLMLEIMPKYRVIVLEGTMELPVDALRKLGYDILRMKVREALLKETTEVPADEGIRTSLRLGDSSLIVGEVRSLEAKALYEAMRVGALANVVAGTIHGASAYGVFDRVVNDLQVPITSFKATDLIVVVNPIKTADGLHSWRRMVSLTEVRKHWTKDPLEEKGFVDLMKYNVQTDELEPTADLISGESEIIKAIASNVRGWAGNWDAVWDNILLRANIKEHIVKTAEKLKMPELLEAEFNALSNNAFHQISDKVREEIGLPEGKRVLREWTDWLNREIRKKRLVV